MGNMKNNDVEYNFQRRGYTFKGDEKLMAALKCIESGCINILLCLYSVKNQGYIL